MVEQHAAASSSSDLPPLSFRSNFYRNARLAGRTPASNVRRFDSQPAPGSVSPAGSVLKPYNGQDIHTTFARRQSRVASSDDFLARLEALEWREADSNAPVKASQIKATQDSWKQKPHSVRSGCKPVAKPVAKPPTKPPAKPLAKPVAKPPAKPPAGSTHLSAWIEKLPYGEKARHYITADDFLTWDSSIMGVVGSGGMGSGG